MPAVKEPSGKCQRILVVDDDPEMRALLVKALSGEKRDVCEACDGEAAISRLHAEADFNLIVSDVRMPRRDGHAVLSEVRAHHPQTKIILITAFGEIEEYLGAMDNGAFEYINKPLKMVELMSAVNRALASA